MGVCLGFWRGGAGEQGLLLTVAKDSWDHGRPL